MNRKLFILTGCLCLLGTLIRAQAPVAQFTSNQQSGCAPIGIGFEDQSANNPTSWEWSFGDGQTSSQQNPTHVYGTPGVYDIVLIVKNASGADAIRKTAYITIYASPNVSFGLDRNVACPPATINFLQYSTPGQGSITNYLWQFGDGTTGDGPTPSHLYSQAGYYNVTLTVTNSGGCSNSQTYTRVLRLVGDVQPNFTWNQTGTSCSAPFSLNFVNQTTGPGTLTYNWTFGGGAAPTGSNATNPSGVAYPTAGSYTVSLVAQSSYGCTDSITQTVPLTSISPVINAPTAGCINTPVNFSNATSPAPLSSLWNFHDGTPNSSQPNATHTFTTAGTYIVTLTNTYANCTSTSSDTITIGGNLVPAFTAAPTGACQAPLAVQFTDQTSPVPTQWTWDFGDGSPTSNQQNPLHQYNSTGSFDVKLTATAAGGCTGTVTQTKEININPPTITMAGQGACVGQTFTPAYTISGSDPVSTYSWSAPGATPATATGANPSFTYALPGFYNLTLTITTASGCTATQTFNNAVEVGTPVSPAPTFTYTPSSPICGKELVTFTSPTAPADQWYWTWGDGAHIDSGQTATHEFLRFGTMTVVLGVSHDGCVTQATQLVTVNPPIPNFGWVVNCATNSPLANPLSVSFLDSTLTIKPPTLTPLSYDWSFGDGQSDYITNTAPWSAPTHTYLAMGTYTVTLTVTNGSCISTATKTINLESVSAQFTGTPNPVCVQKNFTLTSTTTVLPAGSTLGAYIWNITPTEHDRAGNTYTTHFNTAGNYPITLTVIDANGCQYTSNPISFDVESPTAKFTVPPGGCDDSTITFADNSTPSGLAAAITSWGFNFGDNSGSQLFSGPPFTHKYTDTGSYTIIETVIDQAGCSATDTITSAVQITKPHALFIEPDSFYCPGTMATFTDLSQGYSLTESWNYGDGTGTFTKNTHSFPATSGVTYPVTLTVTDKYGCSADTSESIRIMSPTAAFTIADTTGICIPLQTNFTSQSTNYDSLAWHFGDGGSISQLPNPSWFYNGFNTYTASLLAYGPGGCVDSVSRNVYLYDPKKSTTFIFTPKTACDSVVAHFTIVPPPYTRFTLNFGDNTADSSGNLAPIHTYRSPNTFNPLLYLTDSTGCIVSINDTSLTVLGAVPFFSATPTAFCDTGTVSFTDYTITNNGVLSKTYFWGDGTSSSEPPPQTAAFNTTYDFTSPGFRYVTLTVVTLANCTASYTDTIRVYQTPKPVISDSGYLCAGLVQFLGKLAVPDPDTIYWKWDFGNGTTSGFQNPPVSLTAGTYNIKLTASVVIGCSDTTSGTFTVNPNPTIKGPKQISTPVGVPVTIPFTYSPDVTTWAWTPTANLSCTGCGNPAATLTFAQTYSVLVTDSNNCTDTASILINTICDAGNYFVPNTFSPNGDGVNDYFYPRGKGLYNIQSLTIFNRWGQMVFQRKNFPANSETMGWDGTINGKPAPMDAYVYVLEVICENAQVIALHGNVTLIR